MSSRNLKMRWPGPSLGCSATERERERGGGGGGGGGDKVQNPSKNAIDVLLSKRF
jgi:hypothetical protein